MQLFTFGHPCEHQLRRVCIGGTSCPLNGYPDHWCCSFVKGRINFKRDKPCEGARCRWGFAHPPASSFDAVTVVLQEGRACAARMEEGYGTGSLHGGPYTITSPHAADVAHCALNMLRVPPARVATRVGGLLAFAAVKTGDAKIFTQLLKTMKKPVDDYLIGAFEFIQSASKGGAAKKDAALEDLRHDVISIMGSALSHQGELICRPEQLPLQTYYLAALKSATRNKKKNGEALDEASGIFLQAVEVNTLVPPESWTRASRKDSATSSAAASEIDPNSVTPDHKPSTPPTTVSPSKTGSKASTPQHPPAAPIGSAPALPDSKRARAALKASEAPSLPPADEAITAAEMAAKPSPASAASHVPPAMTLFAACESFGGLHNNTPPLEYLPTPMSGTPYGGTPYNGTPYHSMRFPQPEPPLRVFGGLFSLDLNDVRCQPQLYPNTSAASDGHDSFLYKSDREAPLGTAIREPHAMHAWRSQLSLTADEIEAERKADLQAAAAALAAADAVLE